MTDILKKYSGEGDDRSVTIVIENDMLGLTNHKTLSEVVSEEISGGIKNITFDLSNLTHISSSGIGVLISNLKSINSSGGNLKIEKANDKIINIFRISKLEKVFNLNS
ncbi:MAG: STAS domain-containing protein [Bacteroidetes bacterium]|nr:STAS domain-containing protein [Bacteroidota bacterium]